MSRRITPLRLLVVEDSDDQWQLTRRAFEQVLPEAQVVRAATDNEALAYLTHCLAQEEWTFPKLVLLDLYLPRRENSWRVLESIRTLPAPLNRVPVVMLSSSEEPDDIREAYQNGCTSYMVKPLAFGQWLTYFESLKSFWWDTASLPRMIYGL